MNERLCRQRRQQRVAVMPTHYVSCTIGCIRPQRRTELKRPPAGPADPIRSLSSPHHKRSTNMEPQIHPPAQQDLNAESNSHPAMSFSQPANVLCATCMENSAAAAVFGCRVHDRIGNSHAAERGVACAAGTRKGHLAGANFC